MNYQAFYINLERSVDRRARMQSLLAALPGEIPVSRFPAVEVAEGRGDLSAAELGCYLSHLGVLERAGDARHTLILEDDVVFSSEITAGLQAIHAVLDQGQFDLLFLGQTVQYDDIGLHRRLISAAAQLDTGSDSDHFVLMPARATYRWGSFAYVVGRHAIARLAQGVRALTSAEPQMQIDRVFRAFIGQERIRAAVLFPYVVGVNMDLPSTLQARGLAGEHLRHSALIGNYLKGAMPSNEREEWRQLIDDNPDPRALAVARRVYERLVQPTRSTRKASGPEDPA